MCCCGAKLCGLLTFLVTLLALVLVLMSLVLTQWYVDGDNEVGVFRECVVTNTTTATDTSPTTAISCSTYDWNDLHIRMKSVWFCAVLATCCFAIALVSVVLSMCCRCIDTLALFGSLVGFVSYALMMAFFMSHYHNDLVDMDYSISLACVCGVAALVVGAADIVLVLLFSNALRKPTDSDDLK